MLLTAPFLSRSYFFGSIINKCRQVIQKPTTNIIEHNEKNPSDQMLEPESFGKTHSIKPSTRKASIIKLPVAVANLSLSTVNNVRTLEEKIGLPPRPKKPLTPYFKYMQELRPKLSAEKPNANVTEVVREISKRWNTVEPSLKDRLQTEYEREKQKYIEMRTKYDAKLTEGQRAEIKQLKQDLADAKERRVLRKRIKELGRPKKPASAYLLFIAKERLDSPQTSKQTYREWHQKSTAKWSRLSTEEKAVYIQTAREDIEKYKKDIAAWEEKMIQQGNVDVVRHHSLIDPPEPKAKKQ